MNSVPKISVFTATSIVVANMIGTGVFTSLGFQAAQIRSGFALILLWVVGGVFALCGALSYAELAAAMPRSGGEFNFLSRIYHPAVGFVAGWTSVTVGFAAPIALAAMAFGKYSVGVFPNGNPLLASSALIIAIALAHATNLHVGSIFQNSVTVLKVLIIVGFIGAGLFFGHAQPLSLLPSAGDLGVSLSAPFAVSLIYVMYAYSGWNASTYIIEEISAPRKNLPRSLVCGTLIVTVLYVALNATFLRTTPLDKLAGQLEVGFIAAREIFGAAGGRFVAAAICVSLVSCISAMTWTGPRISQAMGEDFAALRFLATKSRAAIPVVAIFFQSLIVLALLFTSTFEIVLIYTQFTLNLCAFLTVLGVIWMRVKAPALPRPYRTWGYPFTPLVFLAISLTTMIHLLKTNPRESLAGLATMLAGLIIYFASPRRAALAPPGTSADVALP